MFRWMLRDLLTCNSTRPQHTLQMFADHYGPRQTIPWETINQGLLQPQGELFFIVKTSENAKVKIPCKIAIILCFSVVLTVKFAITEISRKFDCFLFFWFYLTFASSISGTVPPKVGHHSNIAHNQHYLGKFGQSQSSFAWQTMELMEGVVMFTHCLQWMPQL